MEIHLYAQSEVHIEVFEKLRPRKVRPTVTHNMLKTNIENKDHENSGGQ